MSQKNQPFGIDLHVHWCLALPQIIRLVQLSRMLVTVRNQLHIGAAMLHLNCLAIAHRTGDVIRFEAFFHVALIVTFNFWNKKNSRKHFQKLKKSTWMHPMPPWQMWHFNARRVSGMALTFGFDIFSGSPIVTSGIHNAHWMWTHSPLVARFIEPPYWPHR